MTEAEGKLPALRTTEAEGKLPALRTTEAEGRLPALRMTEAEGRLPALRMTEAEGKLPARCRRRIVTLSPPVRYRNVTLRAPVADASEGSGGGRVGAASTHAFVRSHGRG